MRLLSRDDSADRRQAHKALSPPIGEVDQFPSDYGSWGQPRQDDEGDDTHDRVLNVHPGMMDVENVSWQAPLPDDVNDLRDDDAPFVPLNAVIHGPAKPEAVAWETQPEAESEEAVDPDAPYIPLGAQMERHHHISPRVLMAAAGVTLLTIAVWIVAEVAYVNGNAWGMWDEVWYAAGVITIAAGVAWLVYGYRWYQHRRTLL